MISETPTPRGCPRSVATLLITAGKSARRRTVRLLAPLAADLAAWRLACEASAPDMPLGTYGHVIEELEDTPQLPAGEAIRRAREERTGAAVYPFRTSRLALEGAASSETAAPAARPDQDSNLGPTP